MGRYVVNFNPVIYDKPNLKWLLDIELRIANKISITYEEADYFLCALIYMVRKSIDDRMENFNSECYTALEKLVNYLFSLDVFMQPLHTWDAVKFMSVSHYFLLVVISVENQLKTFILDPAFIQFFDKKILAEERYGITINNVRTPGPAKYIKDADMPIVIRFLNQGFELFDEKMAEIYGNSFLNTAYDYRHSFKSLSGKTWIEQFFLKQYEPIEIYGNAPKSFLGKIY